MHDKIPTNRARNPGLEPVQTVQPEGNKKRGKPFQIVRFHSVNVPIYAVLNHAIREGLLAQIEDGTL